MRNRRHYNQSYKKSFRSKKAIEGIKGRVIKYIRNLSEHEQEDYYKPVRAVSFFSNNYIEYESNGDGNKTLSVE